MAKPKMKAVHRVFKEVEFDQEKNPIVSKDGTKKLVKVKRVVRHNAMYYPN